MTPQEPLLEAALSAGLRLPHGCRGGQCGACRARLVAGQVHYPHGTPLGLSNAEAAEGYILLCQARARTDLVIETLEVQTPEESTTRRLPSRIERAERWSHDVMGVYLKLPAAETFRFQPGQYIDVLLSDNRRRSFSIASPPHDSRLLELHVRRVVGGAWTEGVFAATARGTLLTIEGPLGRFVYRPREVPMLLVGGGTGLAPLKSLWRHVIELGIARDIILYWGARTEADLYALPGLEEIARRAPNFRYVPVLSQPGPEWRGRRGWVHEAVLEEVEALDRHDIYASGPPAMIEALRRDFRQRGVPDENISFDAFDYAVDSRERQRMTALTKS